jgi:tetratricopeptide (TPR) repeat protein
MMKKSFLLVISVFLSMYVFAQDAAKLISQADSLKNLKKFAEAFDLYDNALKNLGQVKVKGSINFTVGQVAMNAGKNEAAIAYLDKAIAAESADTSLNIDLIKCYQYKGQVYGRMKDLANSLTAYEKAIELSPNNTGTLYYNAALTAFNLNNFEKAVSYFDKAYEAGVKPEDALLNKANALKRLNNDSLYLQALLTGVEKFPANKNFSSKLAAIYYTDGTKLYKSGRDIYDAAYKKISEKKLKPEDAEYKNEIVKVNAEYAKATDILNKAIALDPANVNAQKLLVACKPVK